MRSTRHRAFTGFVLALQLSKYTLSSIVIYICFVWFEYRVASMLPCVFTTILKIKVSAFSVGRNLKLFN